MVDLRITEEERRERAIYRAAMENDTRLELDPPATKEEIASFERKKAEMRKDEKEAAKRGQKIMWEMPFD